MIRMRDVAARLGLSATTVSHVLSGKHGQYKISPATVARVLKTARAMGYCKDALARSFREKRWYSLALAVEDLTNPFWTGVAIGAESECVRQGYSLVVSNSGGTSEGERRAVRLLEERRVDGLVIAPALGAERTLHRLHRARLPFVQINSGVPGLEVPCVQTDHARGCALAVEHLVGRGHRHILYLGGPARQQCFRERLLGFEEAAARHPGVAAEVRLVPAEAEAGEAAFRERLGLGTPRAVFAANIWLTLGVLRAVRSAGLSIPRDLEVVGFDDIALADLLAFPVTTVAQDTQAIGREAVARLLEVMNGGPSERMTLLAPSLVTRPRLVAEPCRPSAIAPLSAAAVLT
jgi:LacI family transcriptional regulator